MSAPGTSRGRFWIGGGAACVLLALVGIAAVAGFFDRDAVRLFAARGAKRPIGVLYVSGDMGLHFGPAPYTAQGLAAHGIAVVGINSPTAFRMRQNRAEIDAIVANGVRRALVDTQADRLMLIGQSYGADIVQTGLAALPADLRTHVAGVVLVVPGTSVFFRADPTGIAYRNTPDSDGAGTLRQLTWTPVTCIYGVAETDSVCPHVHLGNLRSIGMPGGHFLNADRAALFGHIMEAIRRAAPEAFAT
ncbi:virulence factor [Sphingomonas insulae]|uniref:virulence factor n=1 Tax=Sphingomonas insulae TaxID=424800 RepID=UPI0020113A11|nr:virulence factor [Sphingomonas insulae]